MAIRIICGTCGSDDVKRDAWAVWDEATQQWVLDNVFDEAWCDNCETSSRLVEEHLES